MEENTRRNFIKKVGAGAVAAGAGIAASAVPAMAKKEKTFRWKMVTTWPPHFPMLGEGADNFAKWVKEMSGGRLQITVYGGGELVPPLGCLTRSARARWRWAMALPTTGQANPLPLSFSRLFPLGLMPRPSMPGFTRAGAWRSGMKSMPNST